MSSPIVSNICPVCEKPIISNGFQFHPCDGEFTITLDGAFHAVRPNAVQARTYIYSTARRQESAGIDVEIMPATDAYDDYYNAPISEYELEQERLEAAATAAAALTHEQDYALMLDRVRGLGAEQAAHLDRADDNLPLISLIETSLIDRQAA